MDARTRESLRKKLLALKVEILREGDIEIEPGRQDPAAVGSDEDAQPLTEMSQSIASSRNKSRAGVLARVQAALGRLESDPDSFGLCLECDEPIPAKRLELMPYVDHCVDCQAAADGPIKKGSRRNLTDFR